MAKSKSIRIITSHGIRLKSHGIKFFWEIDLTNYQDSCLIQNVTPCFYIDLIFPINAGLMIESDNKIAEKPFVSPILHHTKSICMYKGSIIFGIRLSPLFALAVLGVPLSALAQSANRMDSLMTKELFAQIHSIIINTASFNERVQLLDNIFLKIEKNIGHKANLLAHAVKIISTDPECSVSKLAKILEYSTRWIEKLIEVHLGTIPSHLISISRMNRFIESAKLKNSVRLTDLAFSSGYYDQSHLIKDLRNYTGQTPTDFRNSLNTFIDTMNHL